MKKDVNKYAGRAYAFFDYGTSKKQIEAELPKLLHVTKTPSKLELSLFDSVEAFNETHSDPELKALAEEASEAGTRYILKAEYRGGDNQETASHVAGVLNQAYHSPLRPEEASYGERMKRGKYPRIVASLGVLGGLFFLSPNITGNAIADLSTKTTSFLGAGLLIISLFAGLFLMKIKKKQLFKRSRIFYFLRANECKEQV